MLVGRKKETAMIERFLAGLTAGLSALLLDGEPGIGKTALLADAHAMADQLGYVVLPAFPAGLDRESDLTALADVMAAIPAEEVDRLPLPQRRAVLAVARQADLQWRDPSGPTIAAALLSLLRGLSTKKPVLLLIDDLQWLDSVSARVLSLVLSRLRREPVGLLAGVRAGWSGNLPPLATDHLLTSRVNRLRLDALDLAELRSRNFRRKSVIGPDAGRSSSGPGDA
jgi:predicted ATPase